MTCMKQHLRVFLPQHLFIYFLHGFFLYFIWFCLSSSITFISLDLPLFSVFTPPYLCMSGIFSSEAFVKQKLFKSILNCTGFCCCSSVPSLPFSLLPFLSPTLGDKEGRCSCFQPVGERAAFLWLTLSWTWWVSEKGNVAVGSGSGLKMLMLLVFWDVRMQILPPLRSSDLRESLTDNKLEGTFSVSRTVLCADPDGSLLQYVEMFSLLILQNLTLYLLIKWYI